MGRIIAAALVGYVAIGVLVVTTDKVIEAIIPGFATLEVRPLLYFIVSLATDFVYSVLGGYLCCVIARDRCRNATLVLLIGGELIGIASQLALWHTVPHWFGIVLLLLYPPAVWIGSSLRSRSAKSPLQATG
jgi:hypothetical protein